MKNSSNKKFFNNFGAHFANGILRHTYDKSLIFYDLRQVRNTHITVLNKGFIKDFALSSEQLLDYYAINILGRIRNIAYRQNSSQICRLQ